MSYNNNTNMYEGYIYLIYNDVNNRKYVGQTTTTIEKRWIDHKCAIKRTDRYNTPLYVDMRKIGIEHYSYKMIKKICSSTKELLIKELDKNEKYYIEHYKTSIDYDGYNIENGGRHNIKRVYQYDCDLNLISIYSGLKEASKETGIEESIIRRVCTHDRLTGNNYVWCYEGDNPIPPINRQQRGKRYKYYMKTADGNIVESFNAIKDISKYFNLKNCKNSILSVVNTNKRYRNYYWEQIAI